MPKRTKSYEDDLHNRLRQPEYAVEYLSAALKDEDVHADAVFPAGVVGCSASSEPRCLIRTFLVFWGMEVRLTPELEAKLAHSASQLGRKPEELAQDVLAQYCEDQSRLVEAVALGEQALNRGEYLTHEQVGQRLQRFLRT